MSRQRALQVIKDLVAELDDDQLVELIAGIRVFVGEQIRQTIEELCKKHLIFEAALEDIDDD